MLVCVPVISEAAFTVVTASVRVRVVLVAQKELRSLSPREKAKMT